MLLLLRRKFVMLTVLIFSGAMGGVKPDIQSRSVSAIDQPPDILVEIF